MAETWLTLEKVCALTGWSAGHARRASRAWTTRRSESRGRNGKHQREYLLSSLPADVQAKLVAETKNGLAITPFVGRTLPLFAASPEVPEPIRLELDAEEREEADKWFEAISQLLDLKKRARSGEPFRLLDGTVLKTVDGIAEHVAAQMNPPKSGRSLLRKLALFTGGKKREKAGGYPALAKKIRSDEGKSRFYEANPDLAFLAQQKYLNEALSMQLVHEAVCRECKNRSKKPTAYATTRRFLNNIPEGPRVLAREGAEKYMSRAPFILRKAPPVMDWAVVDHRQHDVFARNRLFDHIKKDLMYRPWLTAAYDWGSRKIIGFCWSPAPSSATIGSALRMMARQFGFPLNLYWDHGRDFAKHRREIEQINATPELRGLLSANGVTVTSALPYHPRSKPIESWFARWAKRFDPVWGAAYAGNKPGNCPPKCREAQKEHAKYLAGKRSNSPLPSDAEFFMAAVQWIEEYNETRLESLDHRTPNEVFDEQYPPENRREVDELSLNILLSQKCERTVLAGGCVEIDKRRYEPDEQSLGALDLLNGQRAMILRDPYNLGEAVALDERGRYVGTLHIQQFGEQSPGGRLTHDHIKAGRKRECTLNRKYKEGLAAIAAYSAGQGWQTESEALLGRAIARTGTDGHLLPAAVPGARGEAPPPKKKFEVESPFISDAVAESAQFWRDNPIVLEDDTGTPADAAPQEKNEKEGQACRA
jgi:putative transposase